MGKWGTQDHKYWEQGRKSLFLEKVNKIPHCQFPYDILIGFLLIYLFGKLPPIHIHDAFLEKVGQVRPRWLSMVGGSSQALATPGGHLLWVTQLEQSRPPRAPGFCPSSYMAVGPWYPWLFTSRNWPWSLTVGMGSLLSLFLDGYDWPVSMVEPPEFIKMSIGHNRSQAFMTIHECGLTGFNLMSTA